MAKTNRIEVSAEPVKYKPSFKYVGVHINNKAAALKVTRIIAII